MITFFKKKSNQIIIAGFLMAALLFSAIPARAESVSNTNLHTFTYNSVTRYNLRYTRYQSVVVSHDYDTGLSNPDFNNIAFDVLVPFSYNFVNDQYMNGVNKYNISISLDGYVDGVNVGNLLGQYVNEFTLEYIPNNTEDGTIYSSCYYNGAGTNEIKITLYTLATNFLSHGIEQVNFGTLKIHCNSANIETLSDIKYSVTASVTTQNCLMGVTEQYRTDYGVSNAIIEALNYVFENGTYADFMQDAATYLSGIDDNSYDMVQLLSDLYSQNQSIISLLSYNNTYLSSIMNNVISFKSNFDSYTSVQTTRWARLFQLIEEMINGPTDTEAESNLNNAESELASAGDQLNLSMPDISGELNSIDAQLQDPNITGATGQLYAWIRTPFIIEILTFCFMFGLVRFVFFGKGDS